MHAKATTLQAAAEVALKAPGLPPVRLPALVTLSAILAGMLGLVCESVQDPGLPLRLELHALFGLLMGLGIVEEFRQMRGRPPPWVQRELDGFARRLARRVYLVLYGLMGFQFTLVWVDHLAYGTDFTPASVEVFQGYLGCGVAALVLIQLLAAARRRQAADAVDPPPISA